MINNNINNNISNNNSNNTNNNTEIKNLPGPVKISKIPNVTFPLNPRVRFAKQEKKINIVKLEDDNNNTNINNIPYNINYNQMASYQVIPPKNEIEFAQIKRLTKKTEEINKTNNNKIKMAQKENAKIKEHEIAQVTKITEEKTETIKKEK